MRILLPVGLFLLALALALIGAERRGAMWPDSPRYVNAAAMIHDWMLSGTWTKPMAFAEQNYLQYPSFSIPYHPPGYPAILAVVFLVTGVSYTAAKGFVAICWGGSVVLFYLLQLRLEVPSMRAALLSLMFLSTPLFVHWSQDTMSEIPALFFLFASTWVYLKWLDGGRSGWLFVAFVLLAIAFQCRITVICIYPAWGLFAISTSRFLRLFRSPTFWGLSAVMVVSVALWVKFVSAYAHFEVNSDGRSEGLSWELLRYFGLIAEEFWSQANGILLLAVAGFAASGRLLDRATWFWLGWAISAIVFKALVITTPELRHIFYAVPATAGLAGLLWQVRVLQDGWLKWVPGALILFFVAFNGVMIYKLPTGLIGYEPHARWLAEQSEPGNCFLACPHDQDLIFRYRSLTPNATRQMIRSDRTISTRVAEYARKQTNQHLTQPAEILELLRRGRVRYVVVTLEDRPLLTYYDWQLTARTVQSHPELFTEIARFEMHVYFEQPGYKQKVGIYRFNEPLREGPSDLNLNIPTAGITLPPQGKP
ncbi:MAG: ArnT family glycosyltransferase [Fimbriiglobus sp.]